MTTTKLTDLAPDARQRHAKNHAAPDQHTDAVVPIDELLALHDVMRVTSLSRASVYREMSVGRFPRSVRISRARIAWRASDIRAWVDDLPQ